jgi:hypothetical protein
MSSLVSKAAKIIFPERFKPSLKVETGSAIGPKKLINIFEFDIVRRRTITFKNELTSNPIEDGSVITDNVVKMPVEISYDGLISEASISNSILNNITRFLPIGSDFERLSLPEAFKVLEDLRNNLTEVIIETPYGGIFRNMYVQDLAINDDSTTSAALAFSITFKEVPKAFTIMDETTQNVVEAAKGLTNFGDQATQAAKTDASKIGIVEFLKRRAADFNIFE